jgi:hypothetical protein
MTRIKLLFTGLLDFYWNGAEKFEIGALKEDAHCLTIGIEKSIPGPGAPPPEYTVLTYRTTPVGGECDPLIIEGDEIRLNVIKDGGAAPLPPDPIGFPHGAATDLRYCINMDGPDFHDSPDPLDISEGAFSPIIHINHGTFSSELVVDVTQERANGTLVKPRLPIARYVGAEIELNPDAHESAELSYGVDLKGRYPFDTAEGANYVVFIENGCYSLPMPSSEFTDFDTYYEYFDIRPPSARFRLRKIGNGHDPLPDLYKVIDHTRVCVWGVEVNKVIRSRDNPCDPIYTQNKYW